MFIYFFPSRNLISINYGARQSLVTDHRHKSIIQSVINHWRRSLFARVLAGLCKFAFSYYYYYSNKKNLQQLRRRMKTGPVLKWKLLRRQRTDCTIRVRVRVRPLTFQRRELRVHQRRRQRPLLMTTDEVGLVTWQSKRPNRIPIGIRRSVDLFWRYSH